MDEQTRNNIEKLRVASQELLARSAPEAGLSFDDMKQLFEDYNQQVQETFDAAHVSLRQAANAAEWAAGYAQVRAAYLATVTSGAETALAEMKEAVHPFRPAGVLDRGTENHFRFRFGFAKSVESIAECHTQALSEMIETLRV